MADPKTLFSRRSYISKDHYLNCVLGDEEEGSELHNIFDTCLNKLGSVFLELPGSSVVDGARVLGERQRLSSRLSDVPDSPNSATLQLITEDEAESESPGYDYTDNAMRRPKDVDDSGIKPSTSESKEYDYKYNSSGSAIRQSISEAEPGSPVVDYRDGKSAAKKKKDAARRLQRSMSVSKGFVYKFNWFDMLIGIGGIAVFFLDIVTDIKLAVDYFLEPHWFYASVTTALIVGPSLITCCFGLHWYHIDYKAEQKVLEAHAKDGQHVEKTSPCVWFCRIFFTLLQCGPVVRTVEYLHYGVKSRSRKLTDKQRKRFHWYMLYEEVDNCLLRLFECFLESAPQLAWQLYIVIVTKPEDSTVGTTTRTVALISSWASLAISLVSYHRSLRNSREDKSKMSLLSIPFFFVWRASETGGRVLCLAMFASAFGFWVFAVILLHWVVISVWLMFQRTTFYQNRCFEKVFNIICGYVMIFCFLNLREGHTRFRFLIFYCIFYLENFLMLGFWYRFTPDLGQWYHLWGFIAVLFFFVLHVTFQLLYYSCFHPTKNIAYCLKCNKYTFYESVCYDVRPEIDDGVGSANKKYTNKEMINNDEDEAPKLLEPPISAGGGDVPETDMTIMVSRPKENGREKVELVGYKKRRSSGLQKVKRPRNSQRLQS